MCRKKMFELDRYLDFAMQLLDSHMFCKSSFIDLINAKSRTAVIGIDYSAALSVIAPYPVSQALCCLFYETTRRYGKTR